MDLAEATVALMATVHLAIAEAVGTAATQAAVLL
jgi:hypothetical protein